jgi:hypothetical protein
MEYEYKKFNKPATFCRKNTAVEYGMGGTGRGRVLEASILTQDRFFIT